MGLPFYRNNRRRFWLTTLLLTVVLATSLRLNHSFAQAVGKFIVTRQMPDIGSTSMVLTIQPQVTATMAKPIKLPQNWKVSQQICKQFGFAGETQSPPGTYINYLYSETANGIGMCCYVETDAVCGIDSGNGDGGTCPNNYNAMMLAPYHPSTMANFAHHLMGITGTYTQGAFPHWSVKGCVYVCGNYGSLAPCCAIPRPTSCQDTNPTPTLGDPTDCKTNWKQMALAGPCGKGPVEVSGSYMLHPAAIGFDPHAAACYPFRSTKVPTPGAPNIFDVQIGNTSGSMPLDTIYPGTWYGGEYMWPTAPAGFQ